MKRVLEAVILIAVAISIPGVVVLGAILYGLVGFIVGWLIADAISFLVLYAGVCFFGWVDDEPAVTVVENG